MEFMAIPSFILLKMVSIWFILEKKGTDLLILKVTIILGQQKEAICFSCAMIVMGILPIRLLKRIMPIVLNLNN